MNADMCKEYLIEYEKHKVGIYKMTLSRMWNWNYKVNSVLNSKYLLVGNFI